MSQEPGAVIARNVSVPIPALPAALAGVRIAHVSDFHFRRWNRVFQAAQDLLLGLEFDVLAATGDFGTNPSRWARAATLLRRFFEPIASRAPIFGALGNHDAPGLADVRDLPITFLRNRSTVFERHGARLCVAGLDQTRFGLEDLEATLPPPETFELTVLLAHYPSTVFRLPPGQVDLQLSGHTHGGQIRLPHFGCIWPNDRIACRMARGLHAVGGVILHTNPGIGVSPPLSVRFRCPAEVSILTLERAQAKVSPAPPAAVTGIGQDIRAYKV
jgi:predicted MPP superfamily phosphohydrolase